MVRWRKKEKKHLKEKEVSSPRTNKMRRRQTQHLALRFIIVGLFHFVFFYRTALPALKWIQSSAANQSSLLLLVS